MAIGCTSLYASAVVRQFLHTGLPLFDPNQPDSAFIAVSVHGISTRIAGSTTVTARQDVPVLHPSPVAANDVTWTRREEDVGRALAAVVGLSPGVRYIGVQPGPAADAPWETLAVPGGECVEAMGGLVVRLVAAQRTPPRVGASIRVLGVSRTPRDSVVQQVFDALQITAEPLPDALPGVLDVVVWAEHGEVVDGRAAVDAGALEDASTTGHVWADSLSNRAVVVLASCEAGASPCSTGGLAERLVRRGVSVVVAPRFPTTPGSIVELTKSMVDALRAGRTVGQAIREGRRAVRRARSRYLEERWHSFAAFVSHTDVLATRRIRIDGLGASRPSEDAADWLSKAERVATQDGVGFLGLEHLLSSMRELRGTNALRALTARRVASWDPGLASIRAGSLVPHPERSSTGLSLTPRLKRILAGMNDGFRSQDLLTALFELDSPLTLLAPDLVPRPNRSADSTWGGGASLVGRPKRGCVLWGPMDGHRFDLEVGEAVGRWSPNGAPHHSLYRTSSDVDRALSRAHLCRTSRGWKLQRSGYEWVAKAWVARAADHVMTGSAMVRLTDTTWMWLPAPDG